MEMSPEHWAQVKDLYAAALEYDPAQRADFLRRSSAEEFVRKEVLRLLTEHDNLGSFLSTPAFVDPTIPPNQPEKRFVPGEVLAERFRIVNFIAAGGMGEVYEAEDLVLKDNLAIKTIRPEVLQQNNALARFKREVQLARKVTHPNICRVFDLFWHGRTERDSESAIVFVSMELLRGETLSERIRRGGRFSAKDALPLINQIALGLEAAHRAGVVHRDLKPGNVILVPETDHNQIRSVITDFGLALRARGDASKSVDLTSSHGVVGTPAYMAPEQIEGKEVTKLTDIYALGLIIYEMVTGERAFPGDTPLASAAKRFSDQLVSPRQFAPELGKNWEQAIRRCLERNPNARYSSATEVSGALADDALDLEATSKRGVFPPFRQLAKIALASALILVIAGAAYQLRGWLGGGRPLSVQAARRPTIAVLGFKNLSGKPDVAWVSSALSQMLGTELSAGEQMRIIPSEQVAHARIDLELSNEDTFGRETLSRLRSNMGSDFVVLGSILDMGGQIRIDLTLQDAANGETVSKISESGPEPQLPDLAIRAGERLRLKLGAGEVSASDAARVKASQSSSLEATRFYSEGLEKLHSYDAAGARALLERAVAEDPSFALAHSALAEVWRSLGYNGKAAAEAKTAMDLSGTLSRENRLAIEAQYRNAVHDLVHESEIYKSLFTFYPDNLEYGLLLAKSQYFNAQWREAISTLDALQQLKPPDRDDPRIDHIRSSVSFKEGDYKAALALTEKVASKAQQVGARRLKAQALLNQCMLQFRLGDPKKVTDACNESKTIFSEVGDLSNEAGVWGQIAFQAANQGDEIKGREANDHQIALLRKTESDGGLAWAMTVAGELSTDSGDYPRALREYTEALNLYQKVGYKDQASSSHGNLGWVYSQMGNLTEAVKNDEEAINLARQTNSKEQLDLWLVDLADDLLSKGDTRGAAKQLDEALTVNQETGDKRARAYFHTSRSKLLLAEGLFAESRREAELAVQSCLELKDEAGGQQRSLILAQLDLAENHPQTAIETGHKVLAYFELKKDRAGQIEARTILIEALVAMTSADAKRELGVLASVEPDTHNVSLRLNANVQIARARSILGDAKGALGLLTDLIAESKRLRYECQLLESRMALAENKLRSGNANTAVSQLEEIANEADARGLKRIADKARLLMKSRTI
jgi:eukaryotic-like serine/threonine-protein kinase